MQELSGQRAQAAYKWLPDILLLIGLARFKQIVQVLSFYWANL
jgi:hypothetical protein